MPSAAMARLNTWSLIPGWGDGLALEDEQIIRVHEALEDLGALDPRLAQVMEIRQFAGLTEEKIASALGVSMPTVQRDWEKARTLRMRP